MKKKAKRNLKKVSKQEMKKVKGGFKSRRTGGHGDLEDMHKINERVNGKSYYW